MVTYVLETLAILPRVVNTTIFPTMIPTNVLMIVVSLLLVQFILLYLAMIKMLVLMTLVALTLDVSILPSIVTITTLVQMIPVIPHVVVLTLTTFVMTTTNVPLTLVALLEVVLLNLKFVMIRIIEPITTVTNPLDVTSLLFLVMIKIFVRPMNSTWQENVYLPQCTAMITAYALRIGVISKLVTAFMKKSVVTIKTLVPKIPAMLRMDVCMRISAKLVPPPTNV